MLKQHFEAMKVEWNAAYIAQVLDAVPHARHARLYAERISQLARRRRVIELSRDLQRMAFDDEQEPEEITAYARQFIEILETRSNRNMPQRIADVMTDLADELETPREEGDGIATGFFAIDLQFGLLQPSELTCIGARPTNGKTTFSIQMATHNADHGRHVLYVSLEMGELEFAKRLACLELGIDSRNMRDHKCPDHEIAEVRNLANRWLDTEFPFSLWAPSRATDAEIETRARYQHATHGLDLLIVDHLQITGCANGRLDRYQKLGEITMRLKALAKELRIPVIAQSQLKRAESRPTLESMRESGDIEQNADNVWLLHPKDDSDHTEMIVAKFRHGATGSVNLDFKGGKFSDAAPERYEEFAAYETTETGTTWEPR